MVKLPKLHLDKEPIFNSDTEGVFYTCELSPDRVNAMIANNEAIACKYAENVTAGDAKAYRDFMLSCMSPTVFAIFNDHSVMMLYPESAPINVQIN